MMPRERADGFDEAARELLDELHYKWDALSDREYVHLTSTTALNVQLALKNAVEELAEQQRIATLVALAKLTGDEDGTHEELVEAAYGALSALVTTIPIDEDTTRTVLAPGIAKVLGVKP